MSREIKFRAWDSKTSVLMTEEWYFDDEIRKSLNKDEGYETEVGFLFEALDTLRTYHPNIVLMQYTGLKDKNGVEIYEGDIMAFTVFDCFDNDTQYIGVVEFAEEYACFELNIRKPFEDGWQLGWVHNQDSEVEVIGNIYENPELLEAQS